MKRALEHALGDRVVRDPDVHFHGARDAPHEVFDFDVVLVGDQVSLAETALRHLSAASAVAAG